MAIVSQSFHTLVKTLISQSVSSSFPDVADVVVKLEYPADESHGDLSSNIAFILSGRVKKKPIDVAETLVCWMNKHLPDEIHSVSCASAGFINIHIDPWLYVSSIKQIFDNERLILSESYSGKKIMVEFAHPNTHKEFHIGHLRNICIGESLVRILEANGADVFRANYQGDVGLHVAKAIWGIYRKIQNLQFEIQKEGRYSEGLEYLTRDLTTEKKAEFLGEGYALGSRMYEEDKEAKKEIIDLNKQIYKNPFDVPLWKETRKMSLDYFDGVYKRLGSHFDHFFFESDVAEKGRQLVIDGVKKGIFVKDADGSLYFPGENYGLNNCVFVTKEDYATYEGKELALEDTEYQTFPFDTDIHVVANEQINFFQIAFTAVEQMFPLQKGRQYHLPYGMVKMKTGKISSRTGDVLTADELIDMAKENMTQTTTLSAQDDIEAMRESIAVAAVKYTMLKVNPRLDISFDLEHSVSIDGDSAPYLLYTYARCKSVERKAKKISAIKNYESRIKEINKEELSLLRCLVRFPEVVEEAGRTYSPSVICGYVYDLAQRYNTFYNKHSILQSDSSEGQIPFRVFLTVSTGNTLRRGIELLGMPIVERM